MTEPVTIGTLNFQIDDSKGGVSSVDRDKVYETLVAFSQMTTQKTNLTTPAGLARWGVWKKRIDTSSIPLCNMVVLQGTA